METSFLLLFTFPFFQTLCRSSNTMIMASSNVTCIERERQSLLEFKQTVTDRYDLLSTWRGVECCEWHGVWCDTQNGHVVKLDLRRPVSPNTIISNSNSWLTFTITDKWLEGELSHSLQNLKHLRYLDLSMNDFSGNIPEFLGLFEHLEYLNLSHSGFGGGVVPHHLGNLSRLQYLDLSYNFDEKTSDGPSEALILDDLGWVSSLSSLRYLDLAGITIGEHIDWFHPLINMLPSLFTLNLALSDINIPSVKFVNFTSLNSLDLSLNDISSTIPVWLSNLTSLMHLDLNDNNFHGEIPDLLCNLSSLVRLDLSSNMFSGPIPASLGLLLRLEDLNIGYNKLSGNIPVSLWQLTNLKNLDFSHNLLVGVLSDTHFTKLNNLNHLSMSSKSLALNFSSRWIPPFQLQTFVASSCNIGPHFPSWLQTQTNLQRLDLSNSNIRDTIPKWFENILPHIVYLDLSNNQISGKLPQFHVNNSDQIMNRILKVSSNKFAGSLATFPSNVRILDLSDNLLSGHVPQTDRTINPSLQVVSLSKNRFKGFIPVHFCKVPTIRVLDLSQNKFSGRLPRCLGNLINLQVMDLAKNIITGVVPSSLGSLKLLQSLHLHNNKFEGDIPESLQNLTMLLTMDLGNNSFTGTIPFWIGEKLSNLKSLDLQSNKFTGKIPLHLCQLKALQYLSLAHNNITGTIPRCFENLSGMIMTSRGYSFVYYEENILASMKGRQLKYTKTIEFLTSLDLANNNIVGEIPDALINLVGLRGLNLSGNLLKGQIPMTIGDLKLLESLDLSMNKLSGWIPQSLSSLNFLSYLNLSFNNLSGPIPVGNQIQTLDDLSTYEGNNGLCGPPVSRSCNGSNVSYNPVGEDEGEDEDDAEGWWFYAGIGPGFVVGSVGLLGSLNLIRRWRLAYFEMLEYVYGWLTLSILLTLARLRRSNVFE